MKTNPLEFISQCQEISRKEMDPGSEGPVFRVVIEDPLGKTLSYTEKRMTSEYHAQRTMDIYNDMKEAGLPITEWTQVNKNSKFSYSGISLLMEDLTENDRYFFEELKMETRDLIKNPRKIAREMIEAIAVMNNRGICHFHPYTSVFTRSPKILGADGKYIAGEIKDFKIIDYSNFTRKEKGFPDDWETMEEFNFEKKCQYHSSTVLRRAVKDLDIREDLKRHYDKIRAENWQHLEQEALKRIA